MLGRVVLGSLGTAYALSQEPECWLYRYDSGMHWGIKGYEQQVIGVGSGRYGNMSWPQYRHFGQFDSGSVRRGFQVFTANCASCHGMQYRKYDILLGKVYEQLELASWVADHFTLHPAHLFYKQYYFQEYDVRDRYIHDLMYSRYYSMEQGKTANNGALPPDLSKIRYRPGNINYIYNLLTGYHYKPPYGMEVPKGKAFNPYFDHMILGMPRQLYDGMLEYADGTPASSPQMANDVANFVTYMQRKTGYRKPDTTRKYALVFWGLVFVSPIFFLKNMRMFRSYSTHRVEMYAVRDSLGYSHWKTGQKSIYAANFRNRNII